MTNRPTEEQLKKLPKHIFNYIESVERERNLSDRILKRFCDSQSISDVFTEEFDYNSIEHRHYIQDDMVYFKDKFMVRLSDDKSTLIIHGLKGGIKLLPRASNAVDIESER